MQRLTSRNARRACEAAAAVTVRGVIVSRTPRLCQATSVAELLDKLSILGERPLLFRYDAQRMLGLGARVKKGDALPEAVLYSYCHLALAGVSGVLACCGSLHSLWQWSVSRAELQRQQEETTKRLDEPRKVGELAAIETQQDRAKLAGQARNAEFRLFTDAQLSELKAAMDQSPQLGFIVGPKCIGKSVTLAGLPERLGIDATRAVYVQYTPTDGERFEAFLYKFFRGMATANQYPERQEGEAAAPYLKKVFDAMGGHRAVLLVDLTRASNSEWAHKLTDELRSVWQYGINVIATTSEGVDIVESKVEPRRWVWQFPELPMDVAVKYVRQQAGSRLPSTITDADLQAVLGTYRREFVTLNRFAMTSQWDWDERTIAQSHALTRVFVRGHLAKAKCKTRWWRSPHAFPIVDLLQEHPVGIDTVTSHCAAWEHLVKQNVIRNVAPPSPCARMGNAGSDNDRALFTWQYDVLSEAFKCDSAVALDVGDPLPEATA